ncbi:hypothetical protein KIPB_001232 [Kipferlia bialata]|uniref:Uncharacterized protein n=1 Tax=Kipferlia bialata TaxID=797122 RepID=A0A9K3CNG5_9EUKA|nr:hypothetical protein KIPB_001232 [Kipferlia bialata]|eukprot:g1232.t1
MNTKERGADQSRWLLPLCDIYGQVSYLFGWACAVPSVPPQFECRGICAGPPYASCLCFDSGIYQQLCDLLRHHGHLPGVSVFCMLSLGVTCTGITPRHCHCGVQAHLEAYRREDAFVHKALIKSGIIPLFLETAERVHTPSNGVPWCT